MESITPTFRDRYIIQVPEGTYNAASWFTTGELNGTEPCDGIIFKDYVKIQGIGNRENIVIQLINPYGYNDDISILKTQKWNELDNLTLIGSDIRYAVHDDNWYDTGEKKYIKVTNCEFRCNNGKPAWGAGHSGNCHAEFYNCKFITTGTAAQHYASFAYHDNLYNNGKSSQIVLFNCRFHVDDANAPCVEFQTYGKAVGGIRNTYVTMTGCGGNTRINLTTIDDRTSDGTWYVSGFANAMALAPTISANITGETNNLIDLIS